MNIEFIQFKIQHSLFDIQYSLSLTPPLQMLTQTFEVT